ncbi:hypothetical protein LTR81_026875 [Elasticomyces elasticus]
MQSGQVLWLVAIPTVIVFFLVGGCLTVPARRRRAARRASPMLPLAEPEARKWPGDPEPPPPYQPAPPSYESAVDSQQEAQATVQPPPAAHTEQRSGHLGWT